MDFFRFGSGSRPLVILPGLSVQSVMRAAETVAEGYRALTEDFTIYVFDRREELPAAYSVREMARDTAAALSALGLSDVCLFGASQGGMIAMELALAHPRLVRRLALGSTAAYMDARRCREPEKWIELARRRDGVGLYLSFGESVYPGELFLIYRPLLIAAGESVTEEELDRFIILAEGGRDFDVRGRLSGLKCPVLILGAADDAVLGSEAAAEIAAELGGREDCQLHIYEGYGHAAYDAAPDYKDRLRSFFLS